ncbi:MAG: hypothetical protein MSG64_17910 [Pyrinomonadaceae bacterium MAG19_C2-C3]|nr:hypothetical protein [Pyrinomonadaceae bacterium MAG19_C2-C3]
MKKVLSLALSVLMLQVFSLSPSAADTPAERSKRALVAAKVKAGVAQLGTGTSARVRVLLNDKTKYHGYVTEIADDHFVVADAKTGATAPIPYPEVKGIKGNNLSSGAKIGIGVAIAAVVGIIVGVTRGGDDDENNRGQCGRASVTSPCPPGCVCTQ